MTSGCAAAGSMPLSAMEVWRSRTSVVWLASRSASSSPTQAIDRKSRRVLFRSVGDDQRMRGGGVDAAERDGSLALEDLGGLVGFALGEQLADADDGNQAMREGGLELEVDALVGLVEVLAAFAVADQDVGDAEGVNLKLK